MAPKTTQVKQKVFKGARATYMVCENLKDASHVQTTQPNRLKKLYAFPSGNNDERPGVGTVLLYS